MSFAARILTGGLAVAAGHTVLAGVSLWALETPRLALWFGLTGAFTAALAVLAYRLIRRPGGEGGGGTGPAPDPGEPPWWPGFERDFRAHAERHDLRQPAR